MARNFDRRNAPREAGFVRTNAAVPRSFSEATAPIASRMAASVPVWLMFFRSWSIAIAVDGGGMIPAY